MDAMETDPDGTADRVDQVAVEGQIVTPDEYVRAVKIIQAEYDRKQRRTKLVYFCACMVVGAVAALAVLLLTSCQMPLRQ